MTASGTGRLLLSTAGKRLLTGQPSMVCRSARSGAAPCGLASRRPSPVRVAPASARLLARGRVASDGVGGVAGASRDRPADAVQQHRPAALRAAALAADLRSALTSVPGSRTALVAAMATGPTPSPRLRVEAGSRRASSKRPSAAHTDGQQGRGGPGVARRRRVEAVVAEHLVRALRRTPDRAGRRATRCGRRPSTTATVWAAARSRLQRRASDRSGWGDRLDGAEVGARADDDLGPGVAQPSHRVASRWRTAIELVDAVGDVVGADQDHRDVRRRYRSSALRHLAARGPRDVAPTTATLVSRDRAPAEGRDAVGDRCAPMVCVPAVGAQAGGRRVAEHDAARIGVARSGAVAPSSSGAAASNDAGRPCARHRRLGPEHTVGRRRPMAPDAPPPRQPPP